MVRATLIAWILCAAACHAFWFNRPISIRLRSTKYMNEPEVIIDPNTSVENNEIQLESISFTDKVVETSKLKGKTAEVLSTLQASLQGRESKLYTLLGKDCDWQNPCVSGRKEIENGIEQFANFFEDASITVYDTTEISDTEVEVGYQLSFWYPLPWHPRIIIPAKARLQFSNDLSVLEAVKESWDVSFLDIFFKQMLPRWWDIWHVFSSPSPEYPPIKTISRINKVSILELPQSIFAEARWQGSAKYAGPPLLIAPGFSLFGKIKSARPRREPYQTSLPVEVQSAKFKHASTGEEMKQSTWMYHVPTALQPLVQRQAQQGEWQPLIGDSLLPGGNNPNGGEDSSTSGAEEEIEEVDYQVGYENLSLMRSVTGGTMRGNFTLNEDIATDFETKQRIEFRYRMSPKRIVASIDMKGEVDGAKIADTLKEIKSTLATQKNLQVQGMPMKICQSTSDKTAPLFGLLIWSTKACFNKEGDPSMAIYEMQYDSRRTSLYVALEETT